ncbi:FecR family protein [Sphingomonas crocodyli]|uniref:FecR family protein n=1 Tax=Sphingomonas crocodyli TaxID=1979270 RepID=UPI0013E3FA05|nr:FecR family protein [Sphingomonas crocodyli]
MASGSRILEEVRHEAARWIAERDAGLLSADDEQAFLIWLHADPLHEAAYRRLEGSWQAMDDMPAQARILESKPTRQKHRIAGVVAAVAVIAIVGATLDMPMRLRADAITGTGERRDVTLPDGSIARLNTDSAIEVDYADGRRAVRLLSGEAAFTVAADAARPFTVQAGSGTTTALGTRFIVRLRGAQADVSVTEHKVRVAASADAETPDWSAVVEEGQAISYGPDGATDRHDIDTYDAEGWTRGKLVFVDRPLAEVVAELNRYHPGYIGVIGGELSQRRFSGVFPLNDPMGALDTIQRSLGIGSTRITNRLILLHS